jgi:hypothetical protein
MVTLGDREHGVARPLAEVVDLDQHVVGNQSPDEIPA